MGLSNSTVTPSNMELAPVQVTYNGVDLGGTLSNVSIVPKFMKADIMSDQFGKTVLDRRVSGLAIQVTTELAEIQNKANWKVVFPHAKYSSASTGVILFQNAVADSDLGSAAQLILHPLTKLSSDKSGDLTFPKAVASAESEIIYSPDKQAVLKIVWNILPDTSVVPAKFMTYGDPAINLTAAVAAAAVAGGGNTGNGTVSLVAATNGVTKTETITMLCILGGASGTAKFQVSGSVSGELGMATVGSTFTPNALDPQVIVFRINGGGTNFVAGDSFTIATTASNYS